MREDDLRRQGVDVLRCATRQSEPEPLERRPHLVDPPNHFVDLGDELAAPVLSSNSCGVVPYSQQYLRTAGWRSSLVPARAARSARHCENV
jgi:hypothetical protein